jgi:RNA polymerase sigma-70 factor (ECF subfamily)
MDHTVNERDVLVDQFERWRPYLTSVAYSMLGSVSDAEDAVQESWLRLDRADTVIDNMRAWLTTVVGRICLDMLRNRKAIREDYVGSWLPEPLVQSEDEDGPESHTVMADAVGLALLVVLESLTPAERLAFVLHDVFAVPFDEVGRIIDRTPEAARQLASRARRAVQAAPQPDADVALQRRVVDAFLAAAREGDFDQLLSVLAPDVVMRFDVGPRSRRGLPTLAGADAVARHVLTTAPRFISRSQPVLVNGTAGAFFGTPDDPISVLGFTIASGRIAALDLIADPAKLSRVRLDP